MIVVPVLITSCQVSEKSKSGPDTAQMTMMKKAMIEAAGLPANRVTRADVELNHLESLLTFFEFFMALALAPLTSYTDSKAVRVMGSNQY